MFCPKCGVKNEDNASFCTSCGNKLAGDAGTRNDDLGYVIKKKYNDFSEFVGAGKEIKLRISDFYSNVFRRHGKEERDRMFMAGLDGACAPEQPGIRNWSRPWLYSRFFVVLGLTYLLLLVCADFFSNINMFPGLLFIGSFVIPFTLLVFFWEMNLPRNISFYELLIIFFIGGVLSLVMTLALFDFVGTSDKKAMFAVIVGIVEETGKILACYIFLRRFRTKYILNAILIGAAVGAGFSVFESAGYALRYGIEPMLADGQIFISVDVASANEIILLRGFLSGGGHISWAAISGGAMALTSPDSCSSGAMFRSGKCWILFLIPVVLHSVWDMGFKLLGSPYIMPVILSLISFTVVVTLIRSGFTQMLREGQADAPENPEETGKGLS